MNQEQKKYSFKSEIQLRITKADVPLFTYSSKPPNLCEVGVMDCFLMRHKAESSANTRTHMKLVGEVAGVWNRWSASKACILPVAGECETAVRNQVMSQVQSHIQRT